MDERALLLLGLLKAQSQHGYQLNEFIERNLSRITDMKKPTAYALLERLCRDGYVSVQVEQAGNRPARRVYSITPQGEATFLELLRTTLTTADRVVIPGDIGVIFLDHLPAEEVRALLTQRRAHLDEQIALYERAPRQEYMPGARLAVERILTHLHADRQWLEGVIAQYSPAE